MSKESLMKNYGETMLAKKKAAVVAENARQSVIGYMKEAGKVSFSYDGEHPLDPKEKDYHEMVRAALEERGVDVDFEAAGGNIILSGFVQEMEWNDESEDVVVRGIEIVANADGTNRPFSCSIFDVVNPEQLIVFIHTFDEKGE